MDKMVENEVGLSMTVDEETINALAKAIHVGTECACDAKMAVMKFATAVLLAAEARANELVSKAGLGWDAFGNQVVTHFGKDVGLNEIRDAVLESDDKAKLDPESKAEMAFRRGLAAAQAYRNQLANPAPLFVPPPDMRELFLVYKKTEGSIGDSVVAVAFADRKARGVTTLLDPSNFSEDIRVAVSEADEGSAKLKKPLDYDELCINRGLAAVRAYLKASVDPDVQTWVGNDRVEVAKLRAEKAEEAHATLVGKIGQIIESLRS